MPAWQQAQKKASELLGADGVDLLAKTAWKLGVPEADFLEN